MKKPVSRPGRRRAAVLGLCLGLDVCLLPATGALAAQPQVFDAAATAKLRSLVVVQERNQSDYPARLQTRPGLVLGPLGALVGAADRHVKSDRLTEALGVDETRLQERFARQLSARLQQAGYGTVLLLQQPAGLKGEAALQRIRQEAPADAILLAELEGGFLARGPNTDYLPQVLAKVRLLDAASGAVLYAEDLSYGYEPRGFGGTHLAAEGSARFPDIDTLVGDPARTRQSLYAGADALVEHIVGRLRASATAGATAGAARPLSPPAAGGSPAAPP